MVLLQEPHLQFHKYDLSQKPSEMGQTDLSIIYAIPIL